MLIVASSFFESIFIRPNNEMVTVPQWFQHFYLKSMAYALMQLDSILVNARVMLLVQRDSSSSWSPRFSTLSGFKLCG